MIQKIMNYLDYLVFQNGSSKYELKIVVPESMNFEEIFDEILDKYFENKELNKIKTSNMGSLFEITYIVNPKKDFNKKELIDEIREHNDNLTVAYYKAEKENEIL